VILTSGGSREVEGSRRGGGYACLEGRREVVRKYPNASKSDSSVLQPPPQPGFSIFRGIPSSVLIRDSDKWRESRSRGVEERRRRSGYEEMPRIRIQFSSSTATQAAKVLQFPIFRGIPSSVPIRDSDKWRESRSRGVEENEEVMPASTVGGRL